MDQRNWQLAHQKQHDLLAWAKHKQLANLALEQPEFPTQEIDASKLKLLLISPVILAGFATGVFVRVLA